MVFFRKRRLSPTQRLEIALKDKQALRQNLARRLNTAEMFVSDRREAGERLALDGASDQALGRAEAATRAAEDRARTLRAALAQLEGQIAEIERELGAEVEHRYRDTVADALETMVAAIAEAAPNYDAAAAKLIEAVKRSAEALPDATVFLADLDAVRREVEAAAMLICAELRAAAMRTRSGEAKISLRAPFELEAPILLQGESGVTPASSTEARFVGQTADVGVAPGARLIAAPVPEIAVGEPFEVDWDKLTQEPANAPGRSISETAIETDAAAAA